MWVIAYINPGCSSCEKFASEFDSLVNRDDVAQRNIKFGYLDVTLPENKDFLTKYANGVLVTPTVMIYSQDKTKPEEFMGKYEHAPIAEFITKISDEAGLASAASAGIGAIGADTPMISAPIAPEAPVTSLDVDLPDLSIAEEVDHPDLSAVGEEELSAVEVVEKLDLDKPDEKALKN